MVRCTDERPDRDNGAVVAACTSLLETPATTAPVRFDALSHRARAYVRLGDYPNALPDFRQAVREAPHNWQMTNGLCWTLAVLGRDLDEARTACDASLRDQPGNPEALDSRGLVALKQGRFQDAWNDYDAALRIEPRGLSWLYGRGIAALRLGHDREGRADVAAAQAAYPAIAHMFESYGIRP